MTTTNDKAFWMEQVAKARQKLERLPANGRIRTAMDKQFFETLVHRINNSEELRYWPPLFSFLVEATDNELKTLEDDLDLVIQIRGSTSERTLTQFIRAEIRGSRTWYSGLFDIKVRATLIRKRLTFKFDVPLANGRNTDIRLQLGDRHVRLENTVFTEDDKSRERWDRCLDRKKSNPDAIDDRGLDMPNDTRRLYAKVFDKLAKDMDPSKSQCANDEPNVILLSFAGSSMCPKAFGYGWALDELFSGCRREPETDGPKPSSRESSLKSWIDFALNDAAKNKKDQPDYYKNNYNDLLRAPRCLSGVILFDDLKLVTARINYNARNKCSITHAEMAELERLLGDMH